MFVVMDPDPNIVALVESNNGRNDVIVQVIPFPLLFLFLNFIIFIFIFLNF
jgi:hypothetical protein